MLFIMSLQQATTSVREKIPAIREACTPVQERFSSYERECLLYESPMVIQEESTSIRARFKLIRESSFPSVKKTDKCPHLSVFLFIYKFSSFGCFQTRTKGPSFSVSITNEPLEYLSDGRNEFTSIVS